MATELLNPWAKDSEGRFISIEHAHKGEQYFCPKCHKPFSYCEKGNGPHARKSHFKHKVKTDCKGLPESAIHSLAKDGIFKIIQNAIAKQQEIIITWTCPDCESHFKVNLLKKAKYVEKEKRLGSAQPDIVLLDENQEPLVAIEIVYTHAPEPEALKFYDDNSIVVVCIEFHSIEECNELDYKLSHPNSVDLCYNLKCARCHSVHLQKELFHLLNNEGATIGFAVGINNPFDDNPFIGLQFDEQHRLTADNIVKSNNPRFQLQYTNEPYPRAMVVARPQPIIPRQQYRRDPFALTPLERAQKQERRNNAIKYNYAKKGKSVKKGRKR